MRERHEISKEPSKMSAGDSNTAVFHANLTATGRSPKSALCFPTVQEKLTDAVVGIAEFCRVRDDQTVPCSPDLANPWAEE